MKKFLSGLGIGFLALATVVFLAALALWCYFLLAVLHWVALKVGFSDGMADLLVGVVVTLQGLPILLSIGLLVFGVMEERSARKRKMARRLHPVNRSNR